MDDGGEKRSSEQFSRLKARKVLGVGDDHGFSPTSKNYLEGYERLANFYPLKQDEKPLISELTNWTNSGELRVPLPRTKCLDNLSITSHVIGATDQTTSEAAHYEEIHFQMLNFWAFKVGISLALIYASITTKPGVVNLAMVTVFAVFALSTIVQSGSDFFFFFFERSLRRLARVIFQCVWNRLPATAGEFATRRRCASSVLSYKSSRVLGADIVSYKRIRGGDFDLGDQPRLGQQPQKFEDVELQAQLHEGSTQA
ncbi:unnamed protein product [Mesocestoides corti]|uniref:Uncharacterized protein n=1 Tax=Mesocestoides corti TaxID=53468 RepID=A0A158QSM2_MESCO|nr:unnamed protein product [Mesocestoides corti]